MRRARRAAWLTAVLLVVFASNAAPARADAAAAEVLIQQGLKLRREEKPKEALEKFRQAHEMAPSPRTYGQMGLVEATLKRWTDSETHLSVALSNPDDAWVHKNRAFLDQALALCREHVGDLVITGPAGADVTVAGTPAGTLPAVPAQRVAEGTVEVTATAPGYEPFQQSVSIRPNSRTVLKIVMTATSVAAPAHDEPPPKILAVPDPDITPPKPPIHDLPPPDKSSESHWRGWTALGLGVAGAGAVGLGITWIAINGDCHTLSGNTGKCLDYTYQTGTYGWIAAGVGTAALIAGGIVLFSGPSSSSSSVALAASPSAIWLTGRF